MTICNRRELTRNALLVAGILLTAACGPRGQATAPPPIEVTTLQVVPRDVPISLHYIGQTESSRLVEIRARVDGYLQKKYYTEGQFVHKGDPLFLIDPRPLETLADSAAATLQDKENWAQNARKTQERLKPLLKENAISQKDYDDAVAAEKSAAATLAGSRADYSRADMNLSYTRITSPLDGITTRANVAEGSYVSPSVNGLLTTVAQVDPIWVNFSVSENEWLRYRDEIERGTLRFPKDFQFEVEISLSEGRTLPGNGKVNFASPSVDPQTGTYALRAAFPNTSMLAHPGQFVRVRLNGVVRPGALLVPQSAVMQGQTGKFVYVANEEGKAEIRPVEVGDWHGDEWFVTSGLKGGERIVVGGVVKVHPGAPLKIIPATEAANTKAPAKPEAGK
jgi:membrane fusion protein (multidrug efflux system)